MNRAVKYEEKIHIDKKRTRTRIGDVDPRLVRNLQINKDQKRQWKKGNNGELISLIIVFS